MKGFKANFTHKKYNLFFSCVNSVEVPANKRVILFVEALEVDCPNDFLQVILNEIPTIMICNNSFPAYTISPSSDNYTFKIQFISNSNFTFSGFKIFLFLSSHSTTKGIPFFIRLDLHKLNQKQNETQL